VIRDITERKRSVEQFRLAIEAAPTGMLMMDESGAMVLVNAQVENCSAIRARTARPEDRDAGSAAAAKGPPGISLDVLRRPESSCHGAGRDLYGLRKDGSEIPIEIGSNPLRTSEGTFVLSSVVDITDENARSNSSGWRSRPPRPACS
jgi:PAS domain-containing protein